MVKKVILGVWDWLVFAVVPLALVVTAPNGAEAFTRPFGWLLMYVIFILPLLWVAGQTICDWLGRPGPLIGVDWRRIRGIEKQIYGHPWHDEKGNALDEHQSAQEAAHGVRSRDPALVEYWVGIKDQVKRRSGH